MPLRGTLPKKEQLRLKAFIYGDKGVGKTLAALQFPNAYIIDTAKETTRYTNLIQQKNSVVFYCSDPYEVLKELYELGNSKHNFQTIIIDELTTLYQNLQAIWTDKFIEAAEADKSKNPKQVLLQDFGFRYWDKVKRDWRRIIDALRNLDMNVIVNAHQKDKYGLNQSVIGITSDSEKSDEYVFDFVFRLIIRGQEYKAITEKQRVLPQEIDPEAKQFPKEFSWNYDNLLKYYNKEYLEKDSNKKYEQVTTEQATGLSKKDIENEILNSKQIINENKIEKIEKEVINKTKKEIKEINKEIKQEEQNNNELLKVKHLLKNNNIKTSEFKKFLRDTCKWENVNKLTDLTDVQINTIITRWNKVYSKFCSNKNDNQNLVEKNENNKTTLNYNETALLNIEQDKPIREDQKQVLMDKLSNVGITVERLLLGFELSSLDEITQGGAANMIKNFDTFIGVV